MTHLRHSLSWHTAASHDTASYTREPLLHSGTAPVVRYVTRPTMPPSTLPSPETSSHPAPPAGNGSHVEPLSALRLSIPIAMGYIPLGMAFGFLMAQAGADWWVAPLMSLLVYAGAAQFMAVPMFAAGESLAAIAVATLVVNLRHIFYGLSILDRLPQGRLARACLAWQLTDETYSLISTLPDSATPRQMLGLTMINHGWWLLGTVLGNAIGMGLSPTLQGFDFSLAALFAVLVVAQWRSSRQLAPLVTAIVTYTVGWAVYPQQAMLLAIGLSVGVSLLQSFRQPEGQP